MEKVLLVDTNFSSLPIYNYLCQKGYEVFVVGKNPNDALAKISENYIEIDYSNTESLEKIIYSKKIKNIIPGCTDKSYESCSIIGEDKKFWKGDSYENYKKINNKKYFKELAKSLSLPVAKESKDPKELNSDHVIIKPVDSFSGRGITKTLINDTKKIEDAIKFAKIESATNQYIIEEFIQGQLYSYSAFLVDQKVSNGFLVKEDCIKNPYTVDFSHLIFEGMIKQEEILNEYIHSIAQHLNLSDGLIHTQFIYDGKKIWLIEMTRRCPGDLYSQLIHFSTDFPYIECYTNFFLGKSISDSGPPSRTPIIRHTISSSKPSLFKSIKFLEPLENISYIPLKAAGDKIEKESNNRIGIVFIKTRKIQDDYSKFLKKPFYEIN